MKDLIRLVLTYLWIFRCRFLPSISLKKDKKVAFILLSYKREYNINNILRAAQRCEFIDRIIVSNNNPDIDINEHISISDPRMEIINQTERKRPGVRWNLALSHTPECKIISCVDDDMFLYPEQIKKLVEAAMADSSRGHGVCGSINNEYIKDQNIECDHLTRCYFVNRNHVKRYFEMVDIIEPVDELSTVDYVGDDMAISLAADNLAMIHDVGFVLSCKTSLDDSVAVNREDAFTERRAILLAKIREAAQSIVDKQ